MCFIRGVHTDFIASGEPQLGFAFYLRRIHPANIIVSTLAVSQTEPDLLGRLVVEIRLLARQPALALTAGTFIPATISFNSLMFSAVTILPEMSWLQRRKMH